jgi:hypothetical protein
VLACSQAPPSDRRNRSAIGDRLTRSLVDEERANYRGDERSISVNKTDPDR